MKISQEHAILITNLYLSKQYDAQMNCWMNWQTGVGNLEASTVCWRESTRRVQLSGNQAAEDCVRRVAVEDLMLSQVDKPKGTDQPVRFRVKLPFSVKVCTG